MTQAPNPIQPEPPQSPSYAFPRAMRLSGGLAYKAVYDANTKKHSGALTIFGKSNQLSHPRLGLSVSRKVGTAVKRNRIKRLLREAFRLTQHNWPAPYDIIIVVRPHDPLPLPEYQTLIAAAIASIHKHWTRRQPPSP
jgi:ribonuclease P protein component